MDEKFEGLKTAIGGSLISIIVAWWKFKRQAKRDVQADNAAVRVAEIESESHTVDQLWKRIDKLEARIIALESERTDLAVKLADEKVESARLRQVTKDQQEIMTEYEHEIAALKAQLAAR